MLIFKCDSVKAILERPDFFFKKLDFKTIFARIKENFSIVKMMKAPQNQDLGH